MCRSLKIALFTCGLLFSSTLILGCAQAVDQTNKPSQQPGEDQTAAVKNVTGPRNLHLQGSIQDGYAVKASYMLEILADGETGEHYTEVFLLKDNKSIAQEKIDYASVTPKGWFRAIDLDGRGEKEYLITLFDTGSTYGAQYYLVVYKKDNSWHLSQPAPFDRIAEKDGRLAIGYRDGHEVVTIKTVYPQDGLFSFSDGLFHQEN